MTQALQAFFLMLAGATDKELVRQVEYLKAENQILRSKLPKRVTVTAAERSRLLKLGRAVGSAIRHLITIVSAKTFARWMAGAKRGVKSARRGRPKTKDQIRAIVLRLARENDWGFTRLWGELRKLGINIGKTTLRNILKEAGVDPGPKRMTGGTWDEFVKRHAASLWQCDFVTKRIWTLKGKVEAFVLFFIHVESRKVWCSPASVQPNPAWVAQQARNVSMWAADEGLAMTHVVRDRDGKFHGQFESVLKAQGAEVVQIQYRAPNMNAFAERWAQTLEVECLDYFVAVSESQLNFIVSEFVQHYNTERPHQAKGNEPLSEMTAPVVGKIECKRRLGGLLKHYYREAA